MLELLDPTIAVDTLSAGLLISISALSSFITASLGIGGGMIMLAVLAQLLPMNAVIPVHAIIQLGSNSGRAFLLRQYISWHLFAYFVIGSLAGALLGGQFLIAINLNILRLILGVFILYSVWAPQQWNIRGTKPSLFFGGVFTTFLTMFVGATGPFVMTLVRAFKFDKQELVANSAIFLVSQHLFKALVFITLGFAFQPFIGLLIFMILAGLIGTYIGKHVLLKIDEQGFTKALKIMLSLLAIRLLIQAAIG